MVSLGDVRAGGAARPGVLDPLRRRPDDRCRASRRDRSWCTCRASAAASCGLWTACPPELAPIAELQYRSQWFSHPNNRDWTVRALLTTPSEGSACTSPTTPTPARRCSSPSTGSSTSRSTALRSRCSTQTYFSSSSTRTRSAASCGGSTTRMASRRTPTRRAWTAFVQQCKADFGFDPTYRRRDHRRPEARRAAGPVGARVEAVRGDARAIPRDR